MPLCSGQRVWVRKNSALRPAELFSILARGKAHFSLEQAIEMSFVGKPQVIRNLGESMLGIKNPTAGVMNPALLEESHRSQADGSFENPSEMIPRTAQPTHVVG